MEKWNKYWAFSGERALKTVAQVAIATIGVGTVGIMDVDWLQVASVASLAGVMSLLTSVLTYDKEVKNG
jgi:tRNA A37 threonylcarbamoyladenosine dehydratase